MTARDELSTFQDWYGRKILARAPGRGEKPRIEPDIIKAQEKQARKAAKDLAQQVRKFRKLENGVDGTALP